VDFITPLIAAGSAVLGLSEKKKAEKKAKEKAKKAAKQAAIMQAKAQAAARRKAKRERRAEQQQAAKLGQAQSLALRLATAESETREELTRVAIYGALTLGALFLLRK
jgi:Flp pilus assembly protein TadB